VSSPVSEREQKVLNIIETARAKRQKFRDTQITMAHGAGGKATASLIEGLLVPAFANPTLEALADAGTVPVFGGNVAMTTDSFVVNPITFPGGTIGELAVNGTINDVAMAGAKPLALTLSEEWVSRSSGAEISREINAAIAEARRSICLETYILRGDRTGFRFAEALIERTPSRTYMLLSCCYVTGK